MASLTCDALRAATSGCEVVLLVASEVEAAVLAAGLNEPSEYFVATKKLLVGDLLSPQVAGRRRAVLALTGLDKVNAAHLLTCLLQAMDPEPRLVLQVGIGGALPGTGEFVPGSAGDVVIGTQEAYSDTGCSSPSGWLSARELGWPLALIDGRESGGVFPVDGRLVAAALEVAAGAAARAQGSPLAAIRPVELPRVMAGPCVTSSQVTGVSREAQELVERWGALVESMEGAAAAHVCALYRMPFLEVRGISNVVGDRDREAWEVQRAVAASSWVAQAILEGLDPLPLPKAGARREEPV
jgi:futalosine hydrolase